MPTESYLPFDHWWSGKRFRAVLSPAVLVASVLVVALSCFTMPFALVQVDLDTSWSAALGYFLAHGFRFGPDVIYTAGPLGFLQSAITVGDLLEETFVAKIALALTIALVLVRMVWSSRSLTLVALLALQFAFFSTLETAIAAMITTLALAVVATGGAMPAILAAAVLLVVAGLMKFTNFVLALGLLALVVIYLVAHGRWQRAALLVGSTAVAFFAIWHIVLYQPVSGIVPWLQGSASIASGFNKTMFHAPSDKLQLLALLVFAACLFPLAVQAWSARSRLTGITRALILALTLSVAWKQGMVRADSDHLITLAFTALTLVIIACALALADRPHERRTAVTAGMALLIASASCLALLLEVSKDPQREPMFSPSYVSSWMQGWAGLLTRFPEYREDTLASLKEAGASHALPQISQRIGRKSVDVFGDETGIALLNRWNYRPRPMFQSFSVYTPYLEQLNQRYVSSDAAPDFYVLRLSVIDGRLPLATDRAAFEEILKRYKFVLAESGYVLLERRDGLTVDGLNDANRGEVVQGGEAALGQTIAISDERPGIHRLRVQIKISLLERLRTLLLRPHEMKITVKYQSGFSESYRLLPSNSADGVWLDPPMRGPLDIWNLLSGAALDRAVSFSITADTDPHGRYVNRDFSYALDLLPRPEASQMIGLGPFIGFGQEPIAITAPEPLRVMSVSGRDVFFIHAPSSFLFDLDANADQLAGGFGVMPGAFEAAPQLKAVTFRVIGLSDAGETVLLNAPVTAAGINDLKLSLPRGQFARLRFETSCEPTCAGGWSFWSRLTVSPPSAGAAGPSLQP